MVASFCRAWSRRTCHWRQQNPFEMLVSAAFWIMFFRSNSPFFNDAKLAASSFARIAGRSRGIIPSLSGACLTFLSCTGCQSVKPSRNSPSVVLANVLSFGGSRFTPNVRHHNMNTGDRSSELPPTRIYVGTPAIGEADELPGHGTAQLLPSRQQHTAAADILWYLLVSRVTHKIEKRSRSTEISNRHVNRLDDNTRTGGDNYE